MALTVDVKDGIFTFSGRSLNPTKEKNELLAPFQKMVRNYGLRLFLLPDPDSQNKIDKNIGCARFVRNNYLDARIKYYQEQKQTLSVAQYKKDHLPLLKKENVWLNQADKFALEAAVEFVDVAYKNFFHKRTSFPKFSSVRNPNGNRYTTKFTNHNIRFVLKDSLPYIQIPKVGLVRFVLPKSTAFRDLCPLGTRILKATISRTGRRYDISLQMETVVDLVKPANIHKSATIRTAVWRAV
ncbi:MAG: transposase [Eubacteriales bacterium]|nr:transposase [Eubacteriales bacterium]